MGYAYSRLISRDPNKFWTSGQWMTERRGGSDVGKSKYVPKLIILHILDHVILPYCGSNLPNYIVILVFTYLLFYLPPRLRPGTGDITTPPVCLSVHPSVRRI